MSHLSPIRKRASSHTGNVASILLSMLLLCSFTSFVHASPPIEPEETHLVHEDVNIIAGLYFREYSLKDNGVIDYKTARQIIVSEYNEYWNTVVYTKEHPLFYWYDSDQDGRMDMWVDRNVEGCACDIVPYEPTVSENVHPNQQNTISIQNTQQP
ncbi:MAG: hypothetical protein NPIRA02_31650 [Nitrospirales bacterium]|nr:MAG: hypothetical protein NPIRA02_31650 [Nitrospirales bacterium]